MNIRQIIGFQCRHRRLSLPITIEGQCHRSCIDCGWQTPFTKWAIDPSERGKVAHHTVSDNSIKRAGHGVLKFKQRKEGLK